MNTEKCVRYLILCEAALLIFGSGICFAEENLVEDQGDVTTVTRTGPKTDTPLDYSNARSVMQTSHIPPQSISHTRFFDQFEGSPGFVPGGRGSGRLSPRELPLEDKAPEQDYTSHDEMISQEYGVDGHPFTTSRVDVKRNRPSRDYPFSPAGKLYFRIGEDTYVCSASLIKRGVVVTAAHCVTDFGSRQVFADWEFVPAQSREAAPYGTWEVDHAAVMTSYLRGTEDCAVEGIVCPNDVAVLALSPQNGEYPGTATGWYGYAWNGWGFTREGRTQIHQLGYPVSHDEGLMMQRTDSLGYVEPDFSDNTVWGSRQTGGSSGGPNLVNLGIPGRFDGNWMIDFNIVVGVTSWGYTELNVKMQGSSPFTSRNITVLVDAVCSAYPEACE